MTDGTSGNGWDSVAILGICVLFVGLCLLDWGINEEYGIIASGVYTCVVGFIMFFIGIVLYKPGMKATNTN